MSMQNSCFSRQRAQVNPFCVLHGSFRTCVMVPPGMSGSADESTPLQYPCDFQLFVSLHWRNCAEHRRGWQKRTPRPTLGASMLSPPLFHVVMSMPYITLALCIFDRRTASQSFAVCSSSVCALYLHASRNRQTHAGMSLEPEFTLNAICLTRVCAGIGARAALHDQREG